MECLISLLQTNRLFKQLYILGERFTFNFYVGLSQSGHSLHASCAGPFIKGAKQVRVFLPTIEMLAQNPETSTETRAGQASP